MNALQMAFLAVALYKGDGDSVFDMLATFGFVFFLEMVSQLLVALIQGVKRVRPHPPCPTPPCRPAAPPLIPPFNPPARSAPLRPAPRASFS